MPYIVIRGISYSSSATSTINRRLYPFLFYLLDTCEFFFFCVGECMCRSKPTFVSQTVICFQFYNFSTSFKYIMHGNIILQYSIVSSSFLIQTHSFSSLLMAFWKRVVHAGVKYLERMSPQSGNPNSFAKSELECVAPSIHNIILLTYSISLCINICTIILYSLNIVGIFSFGENNFFYPILPFPLTHYSTTFSPFSQKFLPETCKKRYHACFFSRHGVPVPN